MCSAEFTTHYKFTVHSAELSANSADNSVDFHVFKKNLFLSLIKCILIDFFEFRRIFPNFVKCDGFACLRIFCSRRIFKHCSSLIPNFSLKDAKNALCLLSPHPPRVLRRDEAALPAPSSPPHPAPSLRPPTPSVSWSTVRGERSASRSMEVFRFFGGRCVRVSDTTFVDM
jgi:hypothetical protein